MTMLIFTKHPSALPSVAIFRSPSEDQAPFRALKQGLCLRNGIVGLFVDTEKVVIWGQSREKWTGHHGALLGGDGT